MALGVRPGETAARQGAAGGEDSDHESRRHGKNIPRQKHLLIVFTG
jgi:hypothetical protein